MERNKIIERQQKKKIIISIIKLHNRDNQKPKDTKNTKEKKSKTIPGISKWFEWSWPVAGQFAGYVRARSLPHIGKQIDFSPAQIANLCGTVYRHSPTVSEPTEPNTPWIMPNPSRKTGCIIILLLQI